jgi:kumamolisin
MPVNRHAVPGSERSHLPGARAMGAADPAERIQVTVVLRRASDTGGAAAAQASSARRLKERTYLTREQLEAAQGASADDIARVEAFAQDHGLDVVEASRARRSVMLSGTVGAMGAAFGVTLIRYEHPSGAYRGRTGVVNVPEELGPIVQAVLGLDNRPQGTPKFRIHQPQAGGEAGGQVGGTVRPRAAGGASFTPPQLARLYDFPAQADGTGQCIAIIELGGGYRNADLQAYFKQLGIRLPQVTAVAVDGANNNPSGDPNSADGEVLLDIEVAGAIAPKSRLAVYFGPNTDRGFLDAITTAVHDTLRKPSVISISWGGPEASWTPQAMEAYDQAFQDAAALGVTVCCASGDNGSADMGQQWDHKAHVDFPASSPHVLGCGGTHLDASSSAITSEVVWNDLPGGGAGGGGVSDQFPLPAWQAQARVPPSANPGGRVGRGVPDVSGDASPRSGYAVLVDGQQMVIGGTSAVAPLWAGLVALMNQLLGHPVGYLNPLIYGLPAGNGAFRDITAGSNGAYHAGAGWDACTGLGSPVGSKLLAALR